VSKHESQVPLQLYWHVAGHVFAQVSAHVAAQLPAQLTSHESQV
jgi:hypothetical protein